MNQFKISSEKERIITNKDILELFLYSQRVIEKSSDQTKIINLYHSEKTYLKKSKDIIMQKEAYEITQTNLKEFFNK